MITHPMGYPQSKDMMDKALYRHFFKATELLYGRVGLEFISLPSKSFRVINDGSPKVTMKHDKQCLTTASYK